MSDKLRKNKGKIYILISAFVYGLTPLLAKVTYMGGTNGVTLTFLRAVLTIPLLFALLLLEKKSLYVTGRELVKICVLGVLGGTLPIMLLYMSYSYISVGLASTLHFIYPIVIVMASAFIYHERIPYFKLAAVVMVTIGIILCVEIRTRADTLGIILAMLSGIFYSFYVIYIERSGLENMDYLKLTLYLMLTMSASTMILGSFSGSISFDMNARSWIYSGIISLLAAAVAYPMLQAGIKYEGASTAGILSTLEPVTTTFLGVTVLGESITASQLVGSLIIVSGIAVAQWKQM